MKILRWASFFSYYLSALFFLSAVLTVFAPLPLLFLFFDTKGTYRWVRLVLAILSNGFLVGFLGGLSSLIFYSTWIVPLVFSLILFLKPQQTLEKVVVKTLGVMAVIILSTMLFYARDQRLKPWEVVNQQVETVFHRLENTMEMQSRSSSYISEWKELKQRVIEEFPSALAIFALVLIWVNLVFLFRLNPGKIRDTLGLDPLFFKSWKAPEFLVWPVIVSGFFLVLPISQLKSSVVSLVALNIFKFLMSIYGIQGLSILNYFFDSWSIRGLFRVVAYGLSLGLFMPFVLGLGFFDLWFDFRSKFRQV